MASRSKRELIKGPLRPPKPNPSSSSTTQAPPSKHEISIRDPKAKQIPVVEFYSRAIPQPFLDPSIIENRIQAEKQQKIIQERINRQNEASSSSQRT